MKAIEKDGLYHKYDVTRTDGRDKVGEKHYGCPYFVIDLTHDKHAPAILELYADLVEDEKPNLSEDLRDWLEEVYKCRR